MKEGKLKQNKEKIRKASWRMKIKQRKKMRKTKHKTENKKNTNKSGKNNEKIITHINNKMLYGIAK